jgi:hypothetical protein
MTRGDDPTSIVYPADIGRRELPVAAAFCSCGCGCRAEVLTACGFCLYGLHAA